MNLRSSLKGGDVGASVQVEPQRRTVERCPNFARMVSTSRLSSRPASPHSSLNRYIQVGLTANLSVKKVSRTKSHKKRGGEKLQRDFFFVQVFARATERRVNRIQLQSARRPYASYHGIFFSFTLYSLLLVYSAAQAWLLVLSTITR